MSMKKVLLWALFCCICITCALGYPGLQVSAASAEITDCDIQEEYTQGAEFAMPEGNVSYKGQTKAPDSKYIVFPSGKANKGETIVLSETGKYELVFKAEFDGVRISAKKSFVVQKALVQVNNESSYAAINDGKIQVCLAPDDVFTYNAVLDLTTLSKETALLDMEVNPNTTGTADATRIKIRFTDIYDEENYVTVSLNHFIDSWASGHIYMTAGATHQPQVGVENAGNPDGMKVYSNDSYGYGAAVSFSMSGLPNSSEDSHLTMYFDYDEKALYADREAYTGAKQLITDLDDPVCIGDNPWEGFTTGQVKMTIFASNYQSANCNFTICTINGISEFSDTGDKDAPILSVNTGYEPDSTPEALVGKPYPVFGAQAADGYDGKIPVATSVFYKYYSENPVKISVADGKFTPSREGIYVIEYMAKDLSGNVATECVNVKAVQGDGLQVELRDMAVETDTGVAVKVFSGMEYTNASGNVSYAVRAKHLETGEEIEIDTQSLSFIPMIDGDWEIIVTAQDYISTVVKTFTVSSNHTTQPQVYGNVGIPEYFILGATYPMPALSGYDFSSGKGVLTDMEIFVAENGGQERKLENGKYIPENAGSVTLTYRLTADGKFCEKTYTATVVETGYTGDLDLSKYFVASSKTATALADTGNITYEVNENTKLDFVNFVQVKKLTFSFQIGEKNAYNKVHIYLTDTVTGKQVKFTYNRTTNGATFCVNEGAEKTLSSSFDGMNKNFSLEFYNDTHFVSPEAGVELEVKKFLDGSDFTGITNSVARFCVEVEGVSGVSQIIVKNLNAQTLNNAKLDRFAPQIIVDTKSGDRGKGEKVTLTGAFAYDTLDPVSVITLDVTDPNGAYVKDINGVMLDGTQDATKDYSFTVNEYGDYVIRYTITDGKGKTDHYVYAITAKDMEGPTVTLLQHSESAKKGKTVTVAGTEVKDNITENCTVVVYVFDPQGVNIKVTDGKFEAAMSGVYTVRYMAFDEDGNYAFASYIIDVK